MSGAFKEACAQRSCDKIMWSGIETGSAKPKVKFIFFFFAGPEFCPRSVNNKLSLFTFFIGSKGRDLSGFRCPLLGFSSLLCFSAFSFFGGLSSGSEQGSPGGCEEEDNPVSEASRRNLHNTFAGQPCEGKLAFRGKRQPLVPSISCPVAALCSNLGLTI